MYFRNYGLRKPWLDTCLKSPVSEDPSKMQHGKRAQTLLKFEPQQLYIFIDQREGN